MTEKKTVVVGAGVIRLIAAIELKKLGYCPVVANKTWW